jgi:hypothetical protein
MRPGAVSLWHPANLACLLLQQTVAETRRGRQVNGSPGQGQGALDERPIRGSGDAMRRKLGLMIDGG